MTVMAGLCLVLLRVHDAILLDLWLVVAIHRRDVFEDRGRAGACETLDDVYSRVSVIVLLGSRFVCRAVCRILTVLMSDGALGIDDSLLRCLHNAVGCVVGPAHDDGLLRCGGHGEGSEERDKEGGECKAHSAGGRKGSGVWIVSVVESGRGCFERRTVSVSGFSLR
jgi:hypothetical protein